MMKRKGYYAACSNSGGKILQITKDGNGINAITKQKGNNFAHFNMLEVYA